MMPDGTAPAPRPTVAPGSTAPMTVAPDSQGIKMRAALKVGPAVKMLEQALAFAGSQTEEGQALIKALAILGKTFGAASGELTRAELKSTTAQAPQMSAPNAQAIQQQLSRMGIGNGAPTTPDPAMAGQGAA